VSARPIVRRAESHLDRRDQYNRPPVSRGGTRPIAALAAAAFAAVLLAACGGGSTSTTAPTSTAPTSTQKEGGATTTAGGAGKNAGSGGDKGKSSAAAEAKEASEFAPKHHTDSGGGSAQFKVKGGDNSVQEFGSEADTSELDRAATTLHGFLDARAAGNWAAACSYMSKTIVESFEKLATQSKQSQNTSCAEILGKLTNPAAKQELLAEAAKADVGSLRIEGERAFVIYTGTDRKTFLAMPMAKEGDSWKVASLAGTPLN
jgi:hypothetical protein